MDVEIRKLIHENIELTKENNRLLRKMHRAAIWGRVFHVVYWIIIIVIGLGAYYVLQPYLEGVLAAYQGLMSGLEAAQELNSTLPGAGSVNSLLQGISR